MQIIFADAAGAAMRNNSRNESFADEFYLMIIYNFG